MKLILYSTNCPKCRVLKKKLSDKGLSFEENLSVDEMEELGITEVPVLSIDGELLDFKTAVDWANQQ